MTGTPIDTKGGRTTAIGPDGLLLAFLLFIGFWRLILAATIPITGDEAYFVQWARHLDWCYYDHPGMIAWLMWPGLQLAGNSLLAARLPSILAGLVIAGLAWRLAADMYPDTAAPRRSLYVAAVMPMAAILAVLVSTDTPLAVFWPAAMVFLYRAVEKGRMADWLLAGLCLGGAMLSKFLAFGFLPAAFLYLALPPAHRRHFRTPGPWLALAAMAALFLPAVLWNAGHDWLTFKFNFIRRQATADRSAWDPLVFIAGQLFLLGPVVLIAAAGGAAAGARRWFTAPRGLFLVLFAGAPLAGFGCLSFVRDIGAHWTAMVIVPLAIGFARLCEDRPRLYRWGLATTAALTLTAGTAAAALCLMGPVRMERMLAGGGLQPLAVQRGVGYVYGIPRVAALAATLARAEGGVCATPSYALSATLAFHAPGTHFTVWNSNSVYGRSYDEWDDPRVSEGRTMVYVGLQGRLTAEAVRNMRPHFRHMAIHAFGTDWVHDLIAAVDDPAVAGVHHPGGAGGLNAFFVIVGSSFASEGKNRE